MLAQSEVSLHLYDAVKFFHILMAIIWVGGAITIQFFAVRAIKAGPDHMTHFASVVHEIGNKLFIPASGILFLLGLWMAFGWVGWPVWIWIGVAGFAATFITGIFFLGPESGRLSKMLVDPGPAAPETVSSLKRILAISRIDLAVLIVVVWDMAYKPWA